MIEACLRADGIEAVACGNIGRPFPEAAREGHEALVVECSSFQLRMQESFHPRVSVLLNLAPDHLDEHGRSRPTPRRRPASSSVRGPATRTWATATTTPRPRARARLHATSCGSAPARPRDGEVGYDDDGLVSRLTPRSAAARRRRPARRACGRMPPRPPRHRWRSARRHPPCASGSRRSRRPRTGARSLLSSTGCGSSTIRRPRTCTRRWPRSTGSTTRCSSRGDAPRGWTCRHSRRVLPRLRAVIAIGEAAPDIVRRVRRRAARARGRLDRGCRPRRVRARPPGRMRRARAGMRELGSVPRLRRARRPVRGGGARARAGGGRRWPVSERAAASGACGSCARRRVAPRPCTRRASTCCCCSCRRPCSRCSGS